MAEFKIEKGEVYLFKGEIEFSVKTGAVEAVGKRLDYRDLNQIIPVGKSVPIECVEDSYIELYEGKYFKQIEKLSGRTIPKEWDELLERIIKEKATKIIVLGEMDTGKSFFTTYTANKLIQSDKKVGVIDCDIGQSDLGPPGTMALSVLPQQYMFLSRAPITDMEFIGAHSPGLHIVNTIISFNNITQKALKNSDVIIVNTNGWVHGDGARTLKSAKLELLNPDIVVLMQRENECEPLVKSIYPKNKVVAMHVAKRASDTSKKDRESLRNLSSQNYFKDSKEITLNFDSFSTERVYFKTGTDITNDIKSICNSEVLYAEKFPSFEGILIVSAKKLSAEDLNNVKSKGYFNIKNITSNYTNGILVGLLSRDRNLLALGIIKKVDYKNKTIIIVTPFKDNAEMIKIIQFGSLRYTENGKENGFLEPGTF